MTSTPDPHDDDPVEPDPQLAELRKGWVARYGRTLADRLEPDRRYSLVRVGSVELAFTDYDRYVRALSQIWSAGLVPDSLPAAAGSKLLDVAPDLRAVDPRLDDLPELLRGSEPS